MSFDKRKGYWRSKSAGVLAQLVQENPEMKTDEKTFNRVTREGYPFHARNCFPYKAWLSEVKLLRQECFGKPPAEVVRQENPDQLRIV